MVDKKDVESLVRDLRKQGFTINPSKKNYYRVFDTRCDYVATIPSSPKSPRWRANLISVLKRAGYRPNR